MFKSDKVIMKFYFNSFPKRNNRDLIPPLYLHFKKIKKLKKKKRKKIENKKLKDNKISFFKKLL